MAQVTVFTAERMQEIEDTTVVGGLVDVNGHLLLSTREGEAIDAGNVKGDPGTPGTPGAPGTPGTNGLDGSAATPAGTITLWGSDVAPSNWFICDGSAVSRSTYASLFSAIGTKYGAGDGSTTFNLPNLKGQTPIGKDASQTEFATLNQKGGEKTHKLTIAEMPSHTHSNAGILGWGAGAYNNGYARTDTHSAATPWLNPANTGGDQPHNILQPYTVVNFIIKVTNGDTPGDSQLTQRVNTLEAGTASTQWRRRKIQLMQQAMSGGGVRKADTNGVGWTERFVLMGTGNDDISPSGYFEIFMPPNGTVIPVHDSSATSVTVANGIIPMAAWCALYYDAPVGGTYISDPSRFHLVSYTNQDANQWKVPDTWILLVIRNDVVNSAIYQWADGRQQDPWRPILGLTNGWTQYPGYAVLSWRWTSSGSIRLKGLIRSGSGLIADFGAPLGPAEDEIFIVGAADALGRIDITTAGILKQVSYGAGGTNGWVSVSNIEWYPKGS